MFPVQIEIAYSSVLQARKNASIQKAIESLIHASQCRNPHCKIPNCIRIKRILRHTRDCRLRATGNNCQICKQFLFLVYSHAKNCKETNCPVGMICKRVKQNIQDTQAQQRRRNNLLMQQRIRSMQGMAAAAAANNNNSSSSNGGSKPAGSPANTSPPTSKAPPPTPPQKDSPAVPSASPAGGKGNPRTPAGDVSGGKGAASKMMAPSPAAASKPDRPMPAPNVTVNQVPMGAEMVIQKVPQPQPMLPAPGQREHEMVNILLRGTMQDKEKVKMMMQQDPDLYQRVHVLWQQRQQQQQQQQMKEMNIPADIAPHNPHPASFHAQRQPHMSMMSLRPNQPGGFSPQLMRAAPATHYSPHMSSFRPSSYQQQVHSMMGPGGQPFSQQPHHSSQLSRILTRPPVQTYQSPPNAYSQMAAQPHPVAPPPQYNMGRVPPQPQTAGYPHMLGHHPHQMQGHNPMPQQVGPPMQTGPTHQYSTAPQTVTVDPGVPPDVGFVYNGTQQQSFSLNSNNNSNNLSQAMYNSLTPEDQLSRLTELL